MLGSGHAANDDGRGCNPREWWAHLVDAPQVHPHKLQELFFQNGRELQFCWTRIRELARHVRAQNKNPIERRNLEMVATAYIEWWNARLPPSSPIEHTKRMAEKRPAIGPSFVGAALQRS